jgi:Phage integrase family
MFSLPLRMSPQKMCRSPSFGLVARWDSQLHDLRHTAASWLRMQGADIHTVALLLGHKDLRKAARYQHLSPAYLADAVKRLDQIFPSMPQSAPKADREGTAENAEAAQSSASIVPTASPEY